MIIQDLLQRAHQEALRLMDPNDVSALHDFRVVLRRLQCWLSVIDHKAVKNIRKLTKSTNQMRDLEVQLQILKKLKADGLVIQWQQRLDKAQSKARVPWSKQYLALEADIQLHEPPPNWMNLVVEVVYKTHRRLNQHLAKLKSWKQHSEIHRARIAAKHLRYILEPLITPSTLKDLKFLQDELGELRDLHLLEKALANDPSAKALRQALLKHQKNNYNRSLFK